MVSLASMIKTFITVVLLITISFIQANETVTIVDEDGNVKICSVTESGVIVCL